MKAVKMLLLMILLLVILCACNKNNIPSDVGLSSELAVESSSSQHDVQLQTKESENLPIIAPIEEEKQKQKELLATLMEESTISLKQENNEYIFFKYVEDGLSCRMIREKYLLNGELRYDFDKTIIIPNTDSLVERAIYNEHSLELSCNFWRFEVIFTVEKNNYHLDFENGTYTHEVNYRIKDLDFDRPMDVSSDNKLLLFTTYEDGGGESGWGDYVVFDTEAQSIWYIAEWDLYDQTVFCGTDKILIIRRNNIVEHDLIELLDVYTGNPLPNAPEFEYGKSEKNGNLTMYTPVGIAYDNIQEKTLIAYRETGDGNINYEKTFKIYIAVFDNNGKQINTIDTGFVMQPHIAVFPNRVTFESVNNGSAAISAGVSGDAYDPNEIIELGSISY